jgi:tRNA-2-methylthio-N6-dimethylallyladenosine synthase
MGFFGISTDMTLVQITQPAPDTTDQPGERSSSEAVAQEKSESVNASSKKLFIKTWGCQMNVYDSKRMADVLRPLGYQSVDTPDDADFVILNTCHIREKATDKVFSELGRLKKHKDRRTTEGKTTITAVAGCVAQAEGEIITERAKQVDLVFGPQAYHTLPEMVAQLTGAYGVNRIINTEMPTEAKFDLLPQEETAPSGPVAHVAVQEGCDKFCSFCVVPYTRGAEFSRPTTQILQEIRSLVAAGAKEIQLLGQNVNGWHGIGLDGNISNLGRLIYQIAEIDGVQRIRYTTSHPRDMHDELYAAHRDVPQLMPLLHLPVQSGSNAILKAMNRKHERDDYFRIIDKLREAHPHMALSSDFIIGFPGETDQDHEDTMDLIQRVKFTSAYSFKFSPRPGTPAANLTGQIHESVKDLRLQSLQNLITTQQEEFNKSFTGQVVPVLFERAGNKTGQIMGRSPHMQSTYVQLPIKTSEIIIPRLIGQTLDVHITGGYSGSLAGELVQTEFITTT